MLVALYEDHHQLPWWGGKKNPFDIFRPEKHKDFPFIGPREEKAESNVLGPHTTIRYSEEKHIFTFLMGLHHLESNELMAHVSALCSCQKQEKGYWHYPKRIWVQISTLPSEIDADGVPVVYDIVGERKPEMVEVWGGDNGTHSPYQFFLDEKLRMMAENDSRIWTRFFVEQLGLDPKLKAAKENFFAAEELLNEAREATEALQTFGRDKLNLKLNVGLSVC